MKCYNKNCPDHGEFDSCKRNCTDICAAIQTKPSQSLGISTKIEVSHELNAEEPMPIQNDLPAVWDLVISDMRNRDQIGENRYTTRLQPFNGRDVLVDAYQEALDLVVYLRQAIYERDNKKEISNG